MKFTSFIALLLLFSAQNFAYSQSIPELDDAVEAFLNKWSVPGLQLAISRNGRLVYTKGYGEAIKSSSTAMTSQSRLRVMSISKPITSIAIMKLLQDGYLTSLDQKVFGSGGVFGTKYGSFNGGTTKEDRIKNITINQLLHHTSGLYGGDYMGKVLGWDDPMFRRFDDTHDEIIEWVLSDYPVEEPDVRLDYSNFSYCILGRIIEHVTGLSYEDYVTNQILTPLGITSMEIGGNTLNERKTNEAQYYGDAVYDFNVTRMDSHGGWIATTADLVRLMCAVDATNTRREILGSDIMDQMLAGSDANSNYACGWSLTAGGDGWRHNGIMSGTEGMMGRLNGLYNYAIIINSGYYDKNLRSELYSIIPSAIANESIQWPNVDLFCTQASEAPTNLNQAFIKPRSAYLSWSHSGTGPYRIEYRRAGGIAVYQIAGWSDTKNFTLKGLEPNVEYVWGVRTACSSFATGGSFTTPPENYCSTSFQLGCGGSYGITRFVVDGAGIDNSTGCGGLTISQAFTKYALGSGKTYSFSITKNSSTAAFAGIWVDLDGNGIFEAEERLYRNTIAGNVPQINGSFTIPSNTGAVESTKMRVFVSANAVPDTPCGSHVYGESEDYLIEIFSCSSPQTPPYNLWVLGVTGKKASLLWSQTLGSPPYLLEYKKSMASDWKFGGLVSQKSKQLTDLSPDTEYVWRVKSPCSNYSVIDTFRTKVDYCDVQMTSLGEPCALFIGRVQLSENQLNVLSACGDEGYSYYSVPDVSLESGSVYHFNVYKSSSTYNSHLRIWVDLNGDKNFSEQEMLYSSETATNFISNRGSFAIPAGLPTVYGTRMRIMVKTGNPPSHPCGTFINSGEVEDYLVDILGDGIPDYIYRPPQPVSNRQDQARKGIFLQPGTLIDSQEIGTYSGDIVPN